jgi:hypothetical protein
MCVCVCVFIHSEIELDSGLENGKINTSNE